MKKAIFVITLTLVALVIAGSAIGCTGKTTTPTQPMDLKGTTWSGTHVQSGPGFAIYYNVTMNVTQQDGNQVWGTLAGTFLRTESKGMSTDFTMPLNGQVSGNTLTFQFDAAVRELDQRVQVSGNSMTGSGTYTSPQGQTIGRSWNLTRVP